MQLSNEFIKFSIIKNYFAIHQHNQIHLQKIEILKLYKYYLNKVKNSVHINYNGNNFGRIKTIQFEAN